MIYHDKFLKRTQCGNTDPKFQFSLLRANVRERLFNVFLFVSLRNRDQCLEWTPDCDDLKISKFAKSILISVAFKFRISL